MSEGQFGATPRGAYLGEELGSGRRRNGRARLGILTGVAVVVLGGAGYGAYALLGGSGSEPETTPSTSPSVVQSATPSLDPSATPSIGPSVDDLETPTAAGQEHSQYEIWGVPEAPPVTGEVLDAVGPGWSIGEYSLWTNKNWRVGTGLYLANPDGDLFFVGQVPSGWVSLWRTERDEVVITDTAGTSVFNMRTGTHSLLDPAIDSTSAMLSFIGMTSTGQEVYLLITQNAGTMIEARGYTPGHSAPDFVFSRPAIPGGMEWTVVGDTLVANHDVGLKDSNELAHTAWIVALDGVAEARVLTMPDGMVRCSRVRLADSSELSNELLWKCYPDEYSFRDGSETYWLIPLNGGTPTPVNGPPSPTSWGPVCDPFPITMGHDTRSSALDFENGPYPCLAFDTPMMAG
jgi:hypothetical protein